MTRSLFLTQFEDLRRVSGNPSRMGEKRCSGFQLMKGQSTPLYNSGTTQLVDGDTVLSVTDDIANNLFAASAGASQISQTDPLRL
jgi:hypothetical protein